MMVDSLTIIGDDVRATGQDLIAKDRHVDVLEIPPSAVLAALLADAAYEGWDFDAALRIARELGAATCSEIADAHR